MALWWRPPCTPCTERGHPPYTPGTLYTASQSFTTSPWKIIQNAGNMFSSLKVEGSRRENEMFIWGNVLRSGCWMIYFAMGNFLQGYGLRVTNKVVLLVDLIGWTVGPTMLLPVCLPWDLLKELEDYGILANETKSNQSSLDCLGSLIMVDGCPNGDLGPVCVSWESWRPANKQ